MRTALLMMVACAFALGWIARPQPTPPPHVKRVPNNEQLTIATAALVNWLDFHDDDRAGPPAEQPVFINCRPTTLKRIYVPGGLDCKFGVTYADDSTSLWTITLDRYNAPVWHAHKHHRR